MSAQQYELNQLRKGPCHCLWSPVTGRIWCEECQARDEDGGASGLARDVSTPANPKEQVLRTRLERLIAQWRSEAAEEQRVSFCADQLERVLSSLTREREP